MRRLGITFSTCSRLLRSFVFVAVLILTLIVPVIRVQRIDVVAKVDSLPGHALAIGRRTRFAFSLNAE
jgi:hypothetical protein